MPRKQISRKHSSRRRRSRKVHKNANANANSFANASRNSSGSMGKKNATKMFLTYMLMQKMGGNKGAALKF
jgi:hypothetical protein